MKILLTLDHSISEFEAEDMCASFKEEPWVSNAELVGEGCGSCGKCEHSGMDLVVELNDGRREL